MRLVLAALSLALLGSAWAAQAGPKVTIGQGTLVGKTMPSRQGNKIYAFQGIPYAAAPVGELRFMVRSSFCFSCSFYFLSHVESLIIYAILRSH
jgi:Carboxylesterase family